MAYRVYICPADSHVYEIPNPDCPNADQHTLQPRSYLAWHEWAARMAKGSKQAKCKGCGLYAIWY